MSKEILINSLSQFVEEINRIQLPKNECSLFQPQMLFRGHSSCEYQLKPSLAREVSDCWVNTLLSIERDLVELAQQKYPDVFPNTQNPVILLAKLQHYGIPTRLLDLTDNALVALWFACKTEMNYSKDGEVLVFSAKPLSAFSPLVNAVADTYRLTKNCYIPAEEYYYRVMKQPYFSPELYCEWEKNLNDELNSFVKRVSGPLFVDVGNVCQRQTNQGGKFILFPNKIEDLQDLKSEMLDELVKMSKSDGTIIKRLIIKKECKLEIREQLRHFGITSEFLFADSIDDVFRDFMTEQKKHYT